MSPKTKTQAKEASEIPDKEIERPEDDLDLYGKVNVRKGRSLPAVSAGVPVGTRVAQEEWEKLEELVKKYGVDRASDALRLAIYDAYDYVNGIEPEELDRHYAELRESLDNLEAVEDERYANIIDTLERMSAEKEENPKKPRRKEKAEEEEQEPEEEETPYDPQSIEYFSNLNKEEKHYLSRYLREGSPDTQRLPGAFGKPRTSGREIRNHVEKLCPYTGSGDREKCKEARKDLYKYLVEQGIL